MNSRRLLLFILGFSWFLGLGECLWAIEDPNFISGYGHWDVYRYGNVSAEITAGKPTLRVYAGSAILMLQEETDFEKGGACRAYFSFEYVLYTHGGGEAYFGWFDSNAINEFTRSGSISGTMKVAGYSEKTLNVACDNTSYRYVGVCVVGRDGSTVVRVNSISTTCSGSIPTHTPGPSPTPRPVTPTPTPLGQIRIFVGASRAVFSPDGSKILTGSGSTAKLWDAATGAEILTFSGHADRVRAVAFSPDGTKVLTGSLDSTAKLWDAATGAEILTFSGHTSYVLSVAFSPDGTKVLTGSYDRTAKLWDVETGQEIQTFAGHASALSSVTFSPDGTKVLTGSLDSTAKLWDARTAAEIRTFAGHASDLLCVAFSPDGTKVLTGSSDNTAKLWDAATGAWIATFTGRGLSGIDDVLSVAFSPDGTKVLTGSGGTARLWDIADAIPTPTPTSTPTPTPLGQIRIFPHKGQITSVAFSPDGTKVLTRSMDSTVKLWDAETGQEIRTFYHVCTGRSVAFSPDWTKVLAGSEDATAKLWDMATGQEILTFAGHADRVVSVAFSPDGTKVLTGSLDSTAKLWDAATGQEIRTFWHADRVTSVAFSPDGTKVLTRSWDAEDLAAKLWDAVTGQEIRTFRWDARAVDSVAFSPDGAQVLTGSFDRAKLWDAATGQVLRTFSGHADRVTSVAFSPDGTKILTGSLDSTAKLWDVEMGQVIRTFRGHATYVDSVAFSPDGTKILTGSWDGTARLWDIADATGQPTPTSTATLTVTPISSPTDTPTFVPTSEPTQPPSTIPDVTYTFNELTALGNDLLVSPPGLPGEFNLGDVFFRPLDVQTGDEEYTDGFGISVTVEPGEGATFYGKPLTVGQDYVFLTINAWVSATGASLAIGALDAEEAETVAGANLNGSIEANMLMDTERFVEQFGTLVSFYACERGTIVPVFQVANGPDGDRVTVQFDNLEIYRIPKDQFPIPMLK